MSYLQAFTQLTTRRRFFYVITLAVAVVYLFPPFWMLLTSLRTTGDLYQYPPKLIPDSLTLENYVYVLTEMDAGRYVFNSIVITLWTVFLVTVSSAMGGYAFGFRKFRGKELLFMAMILVLTIPYIMYLIPVYLIESRFGLQNNWLGLILPYVTLNLPWGLLIMRGAFSTIPMEIKDAAIIDGCNEYELWYKVLLPITQPALAATMIVTFVFVWEEYMFASTLMTQNYWQTLPVGIIWLRDELQTLVYGRIGAMFVLSIVPVFAVFILFRDFFVKGVSEGMLRG